MRPTYDDLLEFIQQLREENRLLHEENRLLRAENQQFREKIEKLEERLNLNSKNSSKPPSTDQKKNKRAPKGGARKGHPGHHRKLYPQEEVSKRVLSTLTECEHCGCNTLNKKAPQIFQQVDLPEMKPLVTQIELEKATCSHCHRNLVATFPEEYERTCFGPRLISFIGMCSSVYRMSKRTIQTLLQSFCKLQISLGSLPAMERKVAKGLKHSYEALLDRAKKRSVAYVDETSFRECVKTHYVWTLTTAHEALIRILPTRSLEGLREIRPREHSGITVTDRYPVYSYKKHQYCLAHVKRNLSRFAERQGMDGILGQQALYELREIFKAFHLPCRKMMQGRVYYRKKRLEEIFYDVLANGSEKFSSLAWSLLKDFGRLFLFTRYKGVDCTNNAAERTLRHIVVWRKTSYGTQSDEGSRFLERAISVWMTLKKSGREVMPYFEQAYRATFQPDVETPII